MKTRMHSRTKRSPTPRADRRDDLLALLLEEVEDTPGTDYVVMRQVVEMPALEEYLRECGARTLH